MRDSGSSANTILIFGIDVLLQKLRYIYSKSKQYKLNKFVLFIDKESFKEFQKICLENCIYPIAPYEKREYRFCNIPVRLL